MKFPVLTIDFYLFDVKNWQTKKAEFQNVLYTTPKRQFTHTDPMIKFHTDRSEKDYREEFSKIFDEELREIEQELQCDLVVQDAWSVLYKKGDFHSPHNHADANFSAVLYFDYNFMEHTGTSVILQNTNPRTNMTDIITPDVVEGQILVFPSHLLHFTSPHYSDTPRGIVAFDLKVTNWK